MVIDMDAHKTIHTISSCFVSQFLDWLVFLCYPENYDYSSATQNTHTDRVTLICTYLILIPNRLIFWGTFYAYHILYYIFLLERLHRIYLKYGEKLILLTHDVPVNNV